MWPPPSARYHLLRFYTPFGVRCFGTAGSLQPWRQGTFKISQDPRFEDKVRDIVGLYLDPPEGEAVVSVDAKSGIQALDRTQPLLPIDFGKTQKRAESGSGSMRFDEFGE